MHGRGLCEQAGTLDGHEMLLAELRPGTLASLQDTASSRTTVLMRGHNLVVQGQTTKADRSDVDLERKQH